MRLFGLVLAAALCATPALAGPGHMPTGPAAAKKMALMTPMPALMRAIVFKGAALNLTEAQSATFAAWREKTHAKSKAKMAEVKRIRAAIKTMALGDADSAALEAKYAELAAAMKQVAQYKIECRALIKKTLTPAQWKTLTAEYTAMMKGA